MAKIVFFSIGNPGKITRHSVGHYVLKHMTDNLGAKQLVKKGIYSSTSEDDIYFVKSNSYMNDSGKSLQKFLSSERIGQCVVFIIYDDFETNLPKVKMSQFKKNESHNGIRSIMRELQSSEIPMYKFGIGIGPKPNSASKDTMAAWVLSEFKESERNELQTSMEYVYKYIDAIFELEGNIGDCNKLNARITKSLQR